MYCIYIKYILKIHGIYSYIMPDWIALKSCGISTCLPLTLFLAVEYFQYMYSKYIEYVHSSCSIYAVVVLWSAAVFQVLLSISQLWLCPWRRKRLFLAFLVILWISQRWRVFISKGKLNSKIPAWLIQHQLESKFQIYHFHSKQIHYDYSWFAQLC